jgi:predicted nucleotidyltransferase
MSALIGISPRAQAMETRQAHKLRRSDRVLLGEVKRRILDRAPDARVLLYGSAARGEATPESDYDILVITPRKLTRPEQAAIYDAVYAVELERNVIVSTMFYSREEWDMPIVRASPYYKNVVKESLPL